MDKMRPNVNMNGTSRKSLVDQRRKVMRALDAAREALREMAPHGRDYQGVPLPDIRFEADRKVWQSRMRLLDALHDVTYEEAIELFGGGDE